MAATSYNLKTGLSSHPPTMAQIGDIGLIGNGHDPNQAFDLRTGQCKVLGIAKPGAGATATPGAAGQVNGKVGYRIRYRDSSTGTMSLPSAVISATPDLQQVAIDISAMDGGSYPARATHWIVERTTNGGEVYYQVNRTTAAPDGTPIGTTSYTDNKADGTIRSANNSLPSNQGQPDEYPVWFTNEGRFFGLGRVVHEISATCNNGSPNVSSADGDFVSKQVGEDFVFDGDADGKLYKVDTVTDADNIILAENYAGTNKAAQPARIAGQGNQVVWSEAFAPESFGEEEVGKLSNQVTVAEAGEDLVAGLGLGPAGVIYASDRRMYMHSYKTNPRLLGLGGDGRIIPVDTDRGALGPTTLVLTSIGIMGADRRGVWVMPAGGKPTEIAQPIRNDWKQLNFENGRYFWIQEDLKDQLIYVFVVESGESYATKAYKYSTETRQWVGTFVPPFDWTAGTQLPDQGGAKRIIGFTEPKGSANAYAWFLGIGTSFGANPGDTLTGTVDSGSSTSITPSGSVTFTTTGEGLKGIPVTLIRAADGSIETQVIEANTASALSQISAFQGTAPANGDVWIVGTIQCEYRTGRINPDPSRKKRFTRAIVVLEDAGDAANAVDLKCRVYADGSSTAFADRVAVAEDGITITASSAPVTIDPSAGEHRYYVPIGVDAEEIELEFYSEKSGTPWEIRDVFVEHDVDDTEQGARAE